MFALGLGTLFVGYTVGMYGYILIKGYNISFKQMFVGSWPPGAPKTKGSPAVFVLGGGGGGGGTTGGGGGTTGGGSGTLQA